jgi:aminopeptidase N
VKALADLSAQAALIHSLTHAWVQTGAPWMDEGLAQFFAVLSTERTGGRDAALLQLSNLLQPLAIAEPELEADKPGPVGQPLIAATSEIFFRRKAAAVWYMLRGIAGEKALQSALRTWSEQKPTHATAEQNALAFEALIEKASGKDLHWFFDDWVLHDRGLPDLSITDITPRTLAAGSGHGGNWLVSVTVHNQGGAAAEVPVIVRSGTFSTTSPLRVSAFGNATARVLVETAPTEVVVNDGSTPEVSASRHSRAIAPAQ